MVADQQVGRLEVSVQNGVLTHVQVQHALRYIIYGFDRQGGSITLTLQCLLTSKWADFRSLGRIGSWHMCSYSVLVATSMMG